MWCLDLEHNDEWYQLETVPRQSVGGLYAIKDEDNHVHFMRLCEKDNLEDLFLIYYQWKS